MTLKNLAELHFDNRSLRALPADPVAENYPRQVVGACYSRVDPAPVRAPRLICAATEVAALINLHPDQLHTALFADVFSGRHLLPGMEGHAFCYGGHQFGHWAGQLGDGRAIHLGEVKQGQGDYWSLQLKGAGPTPYSRTADGLAVLRSSVREFLCSEAMHHLGVPSTRALSLILTGESVLRDMFYSGNPTWEPGAVVCRVARSFTRFGSFEILSARRDISTLKTLLDFSICADFPHICRDPSLLTPDLYGQWFQEVCSRTASMIAHWMRLGFVHGVMNTDNMSILGLTLDYGPYGWMEGYDAHWTPNTTDAEGRRYSYSQQPQVALWNLAQLGNAIYPLINSLEPLQLGLQRYSQEYAHTWQTHMANKLGLSEFKSADGQLLDELQRVLQLTETDMTLFYRLLAKVDLTLTDSADDHVLLEPIRSAYYGDPPPEALKAMARWLRSYGERLQQDVIVQGVTPAERQAQMNAVNPKYVLRNYLAQQAIDLASEGDYSEIHRLLQLLRNPYAEQPHFQHYFAKRPEWARTKAGCSMLSCSS